MLSRVDLFLFDVTRQITFKRQRRGVAPDLADRLRRQLGRNFE